MTDDKSSFFVVWNPAGRNPSYRHGSYSAAEREAKRLASMNVGEEFFVLCAVSRSRRMEPVQTDRLVPEDDIPF